MSKMTHFENENESNESTYNDQIALWWKFHLKMEIRLKTIVNITINRYELYKIKEYTMSMVNIDFCILNKVKQVNVIRESSLKESAS